MYKGKCTDCRSSLSGPLFWDTIWLGGNKEDPAHVPVGSVASSRMYGVTQQFGCFTHLSGLFKAQLADGIIGLAPREMSYIGHFEQDLPRLRRENPANSISDMFGLCVIEGGGFMTLGGIDKSTLQSPLCYTPFSSLDRYYRVNVESVYFDQERAHLKLERWNARNGIMIDSGSTFSYVISSEYNVLISAFREQLKRTMLKTSHHLQEVKRLREHDCYRINDTKELHLFPTLRLTFSGGCVMHVEGRYYMFSPVEHVFCMGIYSDPSTVIGNNILQNQNAVFDLESKRFGIAKANISFEASVEDITRPYGARNRKVTPARVKSESKSTVVSQNTPRTAFPSVTRVSLPSSPTVPTENVAPVKVETTANLDQTKVGSVSIQPTNSEPINSQSAKTENPNSSPERVALHSLSTSILSVQIPYRNAAGLRDDVKQIEKGLSRSILINALYFDEFFSVFPPNPSTNPTNIH
ncbi:aspartic proteinase-like protein 2 [Blastocystis sp. subtype 4]|uniref:aspartic proteinase-like protein 2 n=1 Tax=Blastocystis sp. subtype 4 TaxID=944170 RepID=UPI000711D0A4|nr:aspartic proteinase-like protein 2 [Blastocystis sp. subtype 4]KNB42064.1 aspartic proteinase-like protein 2 [Blastocystis sp. subtype 4]|eukprot:XP_014525507.1 aspartic proteinase-like protein 2 [Blastocystis sp. subtype 4]